MRTELKTSIDQFAEYSKIYKSVTKWDSTMMDKLCALQCVCSGRQADTERYKACRTYIKENAGFLSTIKGEMLPVVAWQMAAEEEPEAFFANMQECYHTLREAGFSACNHLVAAALHMARTTDDFPAAAAKMKMLYRAMKQIHPFATGQDDYVTAAMLAASGISVPEFQQRISRIEELLRNWIARGNQLQSIANIILLFNVDDISLCERAINIHQAFREKGYNFKSHDMTALLALLSVSRQPADLLADEIVEASDYLKTKKGFGSLSMEKCQRAMMAAGIYITNELGDGEESRISGTALQSMVVDYLVALQTMCICCIVTVTAAASASSASS
ncbi:DUF4003 family protein [Eubacteriales bacterium DFI.9.88]|uniref:DUF4003 family protein n=1 Tax=Hominibacterium faecale TaxID=2839743 RepID=UPI001D116504|nr:DUF4003 family protein [Hominibacterium faecale]MCC2865178.1 DUF4003 domain-containing protein [Anaerovorax odorimutans]MCI7300363.1 DUF4003 domain-containing protein [Clostridia bacterium]MDE8732713.1 DUF4003 family protein [Eubacteriales bacterium DFI.9.88]